MKLILQIKKLKLTSQVNKIKLNRKLANKTTNAYVIKNKKGQYLSNAYVYAWADNFDDEEGVYIILDEAFAKETLKRVQNYLKDGKLVKVKIIEEVEGE